MQRILGVGRIGVGVVVKKVGNSRKRVWLYRSHFVFALVDGASAAVFMAEGHGVAN